MFLSLWAALKITRHDDFMAVHLVNCVIPAKTQSKLSHFSLEANPAFDCGAYVTISKLELLIKIMHVYTYL
jgi:hypothetical protein